MALLDLEVLHVLTRPTFQFHVLLDIMASVMLIHNSLLLVSHSAQALVWTQSPKVLLFHTPDMPLHTPPGDLGSVRPKLTPLSTPLPQLTLTPPIRRRCSPRRRCHIRRTCPLFPCRNLHQRRRSPGPMLDAFPDFPPPGMLVTW